MAPRTTVRAALDAAILPGVTTVLAYATLAQGAFYLPQAGLTAVLGLLLALAALAAQPAIIRTGTLGFGALVAGLAASAAANGWPVQGLLPATGLATAFGLFLAGRRLVTRGDLVPLLSSIAWLGAAAGLLGLVGLAFHIVPWAMFATDLWRVASTITYANAAGGLLLLTLPATLLLILRADVAEASEATHWQGIAARLAAFLALAGLFASLSRGAIAGAVVAGVVMLVLGQRKALAVLLRPALAAALTMVALLPSIIGPARPVLGVIGILGGAVLAAAPLTERARLVLRRGALVAGLIAAAAVPILAGADLPRLVASRLDLGAEPRFAAWGATFEAALERPIFGTGPGTFLATTRAGEPVVGRFAHNEYLQTFVETGLAGLASVVFALAAFTRTALRNRRGVTSVAAIAVCAGFLVQSGVDFVWRFPVLLALAFLWYAIAIRPSEVDA